MKTPAALAALLSALLIFPTDVSANARGRIVPVRPVVASVTAAVSGARLVTASPLVAPTPLLLPPAPVSIMTPAPATVASPAPRLMTSFASAAADAPRLVATQGVAEAATTSQEALRGGHDGEARAAGIAAFDGAGALAAPADAPAVPGGPGGRQTSGLAPPTDAEMAQAFVLANPNSRAVSILGTRGFAGSVADLLMQYTFAGRSFVDHLAASIPYFDRRGQEFLQAVKDLVAAHDSTDPAARRFQELAGNYYAFADAQQDKARTVFDLFGAKPAPHMPPSPLPEGEYWDMAAGINAGRYVRRPEVDRRTPYVLFDASHFVGSFLRASAQIAGKSNVTVREEDLMRIAKPAKPIAVLRTKNAVAYVPGFENKLDEMVDWIAPGGQLIIQNDPNYAQRGLIIEKHGALARRLIQAGWTLDFGFAGGAGGWGRYGYDTVVLTRPKGAAKPKTAAEAQKAWQSYMDAVRYANRRG